MFEPSEHLWKLWGLILNAIFPLLPSFLGFSFALEHGVSFLVESNILLSMVVQQGVVILEFSQEKMSTCPSTLPSSSTTLIKWFFLQEPAILHPSVTLNSQAHTSVRLKPGN